jgi:hypothetical protein
MKRAPPWTRRREGVSTPADETEGRRGRRIDDRQGGRYLGIPPQSASRVVSITAASTKSGDETPTDATARPIPASP